jgi:hypothetical protein
VPVTLTAFTSLFIILYSPKFMWGQSPTLN